MEGHTDAFFSLRRSFDPEFAEGSQTSRTVSSTSWEVMFSALEPEGFWSFFVANVFSFSEQSFAGCALSRLECVFMQRGDLRGGYLRRSSTSPHRGRCGFAASL